MPDLIIPLEGGVNLQDDPTACPPGSLRDCLNFEVTQQAGYSLRQGWTFFDGSIIGQELTDFLFVNFTTGWNAVAPIYGEMLLLTTAIGGPFPVISLGFFNNGTTRVLCFAYANLAYLSYVPLSQVGVTQIQGGLSGFLWNGSTTIQQAGFFNSNADYAVPGNGLSPYTYQLSLATTVNGNQSTSVLKVPGNPQSPPDSTFLVNDITYCTHDCIVFNFNNGTNASVNLLEGHVLKSVGGATTYGTVLKFVLTAGDWSTGDAAGYVVVYDVPLATVFPAVGTQINAYTANGVTAIGNIFKYFSSSLAAKPANTRALIYKVSEQTIGRLFTYTGWARVPLTREIQYTQTLGTSGIGFGATGSSLFSIYEYSRQGLTNILSQLTPITSAYWPCQTATGTGWTNINNIKVDDGVFATQAIPFNAGGNRPGTYFTAQKYAFTDVPTNAVILGVQVEIHGLASTSATTLVPAEVILIKPDASYTINKGTSTFLTLANAYTTYGGATDMWGYGWKQSDLIGNTFGVFIRYTNISTTTNDTANIDFVGIQCTYVPQGRIVYIRNSTAAAPTDIQAFVVHYTLDNNTQFSSNNGVGTLTIVGTGTEAAFTAAGKARVVASGEQIRDAPGGGGNLLGWTTSTDAPNSLPCSAALDAARSRWEWFPYNFYADPAAQMALGTNGVEFGVGFDGTYLVRVRTGRRVDLENPRHVIAYASNAHWGYDSGDVIVSSPNRPLTVAGLQLAQAYNIGQPVVGFGDLQGQTLAVFGPRRVFGLQGTDPTNYTEVTLSPALGAFEYTVANVEGEVMWTSFRGVETMSTTNAYGDFDTTPLSQASTPWLQPRLQGDSRLAIQNSRPCCAIGVRNKRQYRLFFEDGYTFSLTRFGPEGIPMGMIGRYTDGSNTTRARHVFQGVRSDGKEVIYATWDVQSLTSIYYPYVARLDVGGFESSGSFVQGYFELNPVYPYQQNNKLTPSTQCQYQDATLFCASITGFQPGGTPATTIVVNVIPGDDTPMSTGNYTNLPTIATPWELNLAPTQNKLFLPIPVIPSDVTITAYGRMIRMQINTSGANVGTWNGGPLRATKMQVTYETAMEERI